MSTDAEKRAYAKGYNAGRKRTEKEDADRRATFTAEQVEWRVRRDAFMCAALQGLIVNGNWTVGGKRIETHDQYVALAKTFAMSALAKLP